MLTTRKGLITVSSNSDAGKAGIEILRKGGSAADAAVAAALVQNVGAAGSYVSFAGLFSMLYYSAKDQKVYSLDAGYAAPIYETDTMSIPSKFEGQADGRKVVVPGFFAGVEAASKRFGKLMLSELVQPAVMLAENGSIINERMEGSLKLSEAIVRRVEELKSIFIKDDGSLCKNGDTIKQKELAETLKAFAANGKDYIYNGHWTKRFVQAVQSCGGKITLEDMQQYKAEWTKALTTSYKEFQLNGLQFPNPSAIIVMFILKLLEAGNVSKLGHYIENAEAFYQTWQAVRSYMPLLYESLGAMTEEQVTALFGGKYINLSNCLEEENIKHVWRLIEEGRFSFLPVDKPNNTDSVITIDREGNIAVLVHSAGASGWGEGIVVDGIPIPNFGGRYSSLVKAAGAGNKIPGLFNPIIVTKNEKPFVASVSIHASLYEKSAIALYNMLEFGMDLHQAQYMPNPMYPNATQEQEELVIEKEFEKRLLDEVRAKGLRIKDISESAIMKRMGNNAMTDIVDGLWIAVQADPGTGLNKAITTKYHEIYDGVALSE